MQVTFRTFADFRELIGSREIEVSLPEGASVLDLLQGLCDTRRALREKIFSPQGDLRPYVLVLRNGRNIASLEGLGTMLADGDVVALFPPVAGG